MYIHVVPPQPLNNIMVTAALIPASESNASIDTHLHLSGNIHKDSDTMDVLNSSYIITVTPESEELNQSMFETSNTSILLTLFLDQGYNISVVTRNCLGTSEPAELYIALWDG